MIHQSRQLHKYHDGPLDLEIDTLATEGFYDDKRLRCHGDELYRAYELLYPRDTRTLTPEVLALTGHRGVAALWCDRGRAKRQELEILCCARNQANGETKMIFEWLRGLGYRPNPSRSRLTGSLIRFTGSGADDFASKMRTLLPRHRLHTLKR